MLISLSKLLQDFLLGTQPLSRSQHPYSVVRVGPDFEGEFIYVADQSFHVVKCYNKVLISKLKQVYQAKEAEWRNKNDKPPQIDMVKFKLENVYFCRTLESKERFSIDLASESIIVFGQFQQKHEVPEFSNMISILEHPDVAKAIESMNSSTKPLSRQFNKLKPGKRASRSRVDPIKKEKIPDNHIKVDNAVASNQITGLSNQNPSHEAIVKQGPLACKYPECPNAILVEALLTQLTVFKSGQARLEQLLKQEKCEPPNSSIGISARGYYADSGLQTDLICPKLDEVRKRSLSMRLQVEQPKLTIVRSPLRRILDSDSQRKMRKEITELLTENLRKRPSKSVYSEGTHLRSYQQENNQAIQESDERQLEKKLLLDRLEELKRQEAKEARKIKVSSKLYDRMQQRNETLLGKRDHLSITEEACQMIKNARAQAARQKDTLMNFERSTKSPMYQTVKRKIVSDSPEMVKIVENPKSKKHKETYTTIEEGEISVNSQQPLQPQSINGNGGQLKLKSSQRNEAHSFPVIRDFKIVIPPEKREFSSVRYVLTAAELVHLDKKAGEPKELQQRDYRVDCKWGKHQEDSTQSRTRSPQREPRANPSEGKGSKIMELIEV